MIINEYENNIYFNQKKRVRKVNVNSRVSFCSHENATFGIAISGAKNRQYATYA